MTFNIQSPVYNFRADGHWNIEEPRGRWLVVCVVRPQKRGGYVCGGSLGGAVGALEHIGLRSVVPACRYAHPARWKKSGVGPCSNVYGGWFVCFLSLLFSGERDWRVYVISSV